MSYVFALNRPPLVGLGEYDGNPMSMDPGLLTCSVGAATWRTQKLLVGGILNYCDFTATRIYRWTWATPIRHYVEDTTETITITVGYSTSQVHTVEALVGGQLQAGPKDLFSASVSASLKITDQISQSWQVAKVEIETLTFEKGYTYVDWLLEDVITVQMVQSGYAQANGHHFPPSPPKLATVSCVVFKRPDKFILPDHIKIEPAFVTDRPSKFRGTFNAVCDGPHGATFGWIGPDRETSEKAEQDCETHRTEYPDHNCDVLET